LAGSVRRKGRGSGGARQGSWRRWAGEAEEKKKKKRGEGEADSGTQPSVKENKRKRRGRRRGLMRGKNGGPLGRRAEKVRR
jgi:hypothetical protein